MAKCDITQNEYICKNTNNGSNTYEFNFNNIYIENDRNPLNENIHIDITKNEISLKPNSSNHYLIADEKAHCSEQWQDWFCIPNYHNNNSYNKFPNTETMAVGKCYNPCDAEYIISKTDKCYKYTSDNDLIYNPLAIIAILGTNIESDTIGIRGSYLNDLYRVNNNDKFIKNTYVQQLLYRYNNKNYSSSIKDAFASGSITNQETFLLQILESFIKKQGISSITQIEDDIKIRINTFITINKIKNFYNNIQDKTIFLNKIKNYNFDIDRLDKLYGKDKNKKSKFVNIIAYVYNIIIPIFYNNNRQEYSTRDVETNITTLIGNKGGFPDINDNLRLIFKYACYNCFTYNFQLFDNYLKNEWGSDIANVIMRISITIPPDPKVLANYIISEKKFNDYFKICDKIDLRDTIISTGAKSTIPYNNIGFYDHYLLSEYSDNTRYIIQLLIIFAIIFCLILFICLLYYFLMIKIWGLKHKLIHYITHFINYVHLFYKWLTFNLLKNISQGYLFICKLCKYRLNITSFVMNFLNIWILIYLVSYLFTSIIDLLSIDYITLLANINYDGKGGDSTMSIVNHKLNSTIFYYLLCIYLISIYIYSAYLIRYSKSSSEYDIISNFDADATITENYLNNLLLSEYASNMSSSFDFSYTIEEMTKGSKAVITYHYDDPEIAKKPDKEPAKKTDWFKTISEFGKDVKRVFTGNKEEDNTDNSVDNSANSPIDNTNVTYGSDSPGSPDTLSTVIPTDTPTATSTPPTIIAAPPPPPTISHQPSPIITTPYSPHNQYGFPSQGPPQQYQQSPFSQPPPNFIRPPSYGQPPPNYMQPSYGQPPPMQPSYGQPPPNFMQPSFRRY